VEHLLNAAIAIALALGGMALFVHVLVRFVKEADGSPSSRPSWASSTD
jgi:hypothetical protein